MSFVHKVQVLPEISVFSESFEPAAILVARYRLRGRHLIVFLIYNEDLSKPYLMLKASWYATFPLTVGPLSVIL